MEGKLVLVTSREKNFAAEIGDVIVTRKDYERREREREETEIMQILCKSRQRRDANPRHDIEGNWSD